MPIAKVGLGAVAICSVAFIPTNAVAKPPNSVSCVYDAMPIEDRENSVSLLMLGIIKDIEAKTAPESVTSARKSSNDASKAEFSAMLNDAFNTCLDLYPWPAGKASNAQAYAVATLFKDVMSHILTLEKVDPIVLDNYYNANKVRFARLVEPTPKLTSEISEHLTEIGQLDNPSVTHFATMHIVLSSAQDQLKKGFAQNKFSTGTPAFFRD